MACACQGKKDQTDNYTVTRPGQTPITVKGQVAAAAAAQRHGGTYSPSAEQPAPVPVSS